MRMPWSTSKVEQLDLVDEANAERIEGHLSDAAAAHVAVGPEAGAPTPELSPEAIEAEGSPLMVPVGSLEEDPSNPRTEFPDDDIAELAGDIAQRGILQPIVVLRTGDADRYRVLFGAKRLRAAKRAGLENVPVVIGSPAQDVYAQVAENQKRHGLSPLDLARFMRSRADAGDSNAEIARRMGIDLTTVAHHLGLLTLPPELEEAFRTGRCTSPRTLYELAKLRETEPGQVAAVVGREGSITRTKVKALKTPRQHVRATSRKSPTPRRRSSLASQANDLCGRIELLITRMTKPGAAVSPDELAALRGRLADLAGG